MHGSQSFRSAPHASLGRECRLSPSPTYRACTAPGSQCMCPAMPMVASPQLAACHCHCYCATAAKVTLKMDPECHPYRALKAVPHWVQHELCSSCFCAHSWPAVWRAGAGGGQSEPTGQQGLLKWLISKGLPWHSSALTEEMQTGQGILLAIQCIKGEATQVAVHGSSRAEPAVQPRFLQCC